MVKCHQCSTLIENGSLCHACAKKHNQYMKKKAEERKSNGLCRVCGKPLEDTSKTRCSKCREYNQQSHAKANKKRIENHLCVTCGIPLETYDLKNCESCREKINAASRARNAKKEKFNHIIKRKASPYRQLLEDFLTGPENRLIIPYVREHIGESSNIRSTIYNMRHEGAPIKFVLDRDNLQFFVEKEIES